MLTVKVVKNLLLKLPISEINLAQTGTLVNAQICNLSSGPHITLFWKLLHRKGKVSSKSLF